MFPLSYVCFWRYRSPTYMSMSVCEILKLTSLRLKFTYILPNYRPFFKKAIELKAVVSLTALKVCLGNSSGCDLCCGLISCKLGEAPRNTELAAAPFLDFWLLFMSLSLDHVEAAIAQLDLLGALEHKDDQLTLTPLGRKMAAFPLEPKFAKVSDTISLASFLYITASQSRLLNPVLLD